MAVQIDKRVLGISLGSSKRDFEETVKILDKWVYVRRMGTDGDMERYKALFREKDCLYDAFGFGGSDIYVWVGKTRYTWRESAAIVKGLKTPVVDGSGLKNTLERSAIRYLANEGIVDFHRSKTLLVSAADRFGMAKALCDQKGRVLYGDLMFVAGVPIPIYQLWLLELAARALLPIFTRLPMKWFYPTGKDQDEITPKFERYYRWADIICGDGHLIHHHMPDDLKGKITITNTVTPKDREDYKARGVKLLVTTTPSFNGRSPGTNIYEAAIAAALEKSPDDITPEDYSRALREIGWRPNIDRL